ncbi:protein LURP-one-related 4 [Dorcoceras hygrometricum]|uniref:Protein LURP-one-related 4 n=1 Tax=Dorcoceras hygrometricum TaxID=472368 RepID=A0A2Z7C245_9LAMI|nr:protein LURP-one-related 4 [Dorcoceras hygrometricum]
MAKIHPKVEQITSNLLEKETYTIWMKSLIFHGNGCTIFNSKGEIAFRVDNYQKKCSTEVFLMDSEGQVLFSLTRKKLRVFPCWQGFKGIVSKGQIERLPWFQVRRNPRILRRRTSYQVSFKCDENIGSCYKILGFEGKSILKIIDSSGHILAEATQKQTSGVALGDDVSTLMVEADADQSLVMALITVYGLINNKL